MGASHVSARAARTYLDLLIGVLLARCVKLLYFFCRRALYLLVFENLRCCNANLSLAENKSRVASISSTGASPVPENSSVAIYSLTVAAAVVLFILFLSHSEAVMIVLDGSVIILTQSLVEYFFKKGNK